MEILNALGRCGKKVRTIMKSDLAFLRASTFSESEHISS